MQDEIKFYMTENIVAVIADTTCLDAAKMMEEEKVSSLLIREKESYVGMVTEGDLARKIIAQERDPAKVPVGRIMSKPLVTIDAEKPMPMAFVQMRKYNVRHLVVTLEKKVVGVLSIKDFANYFNHKFGQKAEV